MTSTYLKSIALKNITSIDDLEIDFIKADGEPRSMTILLGENGTGKTSILKAIALALKPNRSWFSAFDIGALASKRSAKEESSVTLTTLTIRDQDDQSEKSQESQVRFILTNKNKTTLDCVLPPLICAFGAVRIFGKKGVDLNKIETGSFIHSLFSATSRFLTFEDILGPCAQAEKSRKPYPYSSDELIELLEKSSKILRGRKIGLSAIRSEISFAESKVEWDQLSDGERSIIGLVLNIFHCQSIYVKDGEKVQDTAGVVLIDEPDAFLHPAWQRDVLSVLRSCFKNIQFIVTTHNPLTLLSANKGEVIVLSRDSNHRVVSNSELPDVKGWRADQLLMADFFGVSSVTDRSTENDIRRYTYLRKSRELSSTENEELAFIAHKLSSLPHVIPGMTEAELAAGLAESDVNTKIPFKSRYQRARAVIAARNKANESDGVRPSYLSLLKEGLESDQTTAFKWYLRAASNGDGYAMVNVAVCYARGIGVSKDGATAFEWFRKGADAGNSRAMAYLGTCYLRGKVVPADNSRAVGWFVKSAEIGDPFAMACLGQCYQLGNGVEQDLNAAEAWFNKAKKFAQEVADEHLVAAIINGQLEM